MLSRLRWDIRLAVGSSGASVQIRAHDIELFDGYNVYRRSFQIGEIIHSCLHSDDFVKQSRLTEWFAQTFFYFASLLKAFHSSRHLEV